MISALFGLLMLTASCDETVIIDSVEYAVPEQWCGQSLDSILIADPTTLVRLPDEFCYADYRIYLDRATRDALVELAHAARKDSVEIIVDSGYRSASFQKRIIKRRMAEGESFERVARFVAPPGYSQHETGRAVDLVPSEVLFLKTNIYVWMKDHAGRFGFVETYPPDSTSSFRAESWHWYFKGKTDSE